MAVLASLVAVSLGSWYLNAVRRRVGGPLPLVLKTAELQGVIAEKLVGRGGKKAGRLARLFIDVQFEAFPADWCRERFSNPYPPASMVFGDGAWERYEAQAAGGSS